MAENEKNSVKERKNGTDVASKTPEPNESDPCIDEKPQRRKVWDNAEHLLRDKTGLTKDGLRYVGVLIILVLLLFIIVIALGIVWPTVPHHQQFPICSDSACLRASAQVREALNSSVSPCTDVWQWACGRWLANHKLPEDKAVWNQKEELAQSEAAKIRELIATLPLPLSTGSLEWKMKYFYEACMDVDTIEIDDYRPLTTIISELGGWYIMRNWYKEDFDSKILLKNLHIKYGVTPYFKISVVPNHESPGNSSVRISPAGLGLPDRRYYYPSDNDNTIQKAYTALITDVVIILSETRSKAEKFGNDIFNYEKRIAEITPESSELQNPVYTHNIRKVSELKTIAPSLHLHDILTAMFPDAHIDEDSEVIVTSQDYLTSVSNIVATTDFEIMNSYMIWTFVREYMQYLSKQFSATWDTYNFALLGVKKPLQRWEFCANLVQKFMGFAINVLMERTHPVKNATKVVVSEIFNAVRNSTLKRLNNLRIMTNLRKHLLKKVDALTLQIGLPANVKTDEYLKNYYRKLVVIKTTFFDNYKKGLSFSKKLEERRLISYYPEEYILHSINTQPSRVHYLPSQNKIIVPSALLLTPYFEDKFPRAVTFGRLGVEIANAIAFNILPYDNMWTHDLKLLTQFHTVVNESVNDVQRLTNCLSKFIVTKNLCEPDLANLTSLQTLKQIIAVGIAEEALTELNSKGMHVHQPSLEKFEDPALFYLTFAQSLCSISSEQHELYESIVKFKLSDKSLLHVAWQQIPGFAKSLDCPYNDKHKCSDIF